jgi:hypothetical protein
MRNFTVVTETPPGKAANGRASASSIERPVGSCRRIAKEPAMKKEIKNDRLKVFIEGARLISDHEQAALPRDKREAVSGKAGLWIGGCHRR